MPSASNQKGFTHLALLAVVVLVTLTSLSQVRVTNTHPQAANVKGVLIAKGGDDGGGSSGGSSGGGDSSSGSHDSGGSTGSSGSSSGGSSGSSGGSSGSSGSSSNSSSSGGDQSKHTETPKPTNKTQTTGEIRRTETRLIEPVQTPKPLVVKPENELGELENEIETEIEKPEVKELEFKSINGQLEVEAKEASRSGRKFNPNRGPSSSQGQKIKLVLGAPTSSTSAHPEVEIEAENEHLVLKAKGVDAQSNFPLSLDKSGQLIVTTPNGPHPIRVLPNQASAIAQQAGVQNQIDKIELVENATQGTTDDTVFKITGHKSGKLLNFIPVNAAVESQIGAESGDLLQTTQPVWLNLLSSLIR